MARQMTTIFAPIITMPAAPHVAVFGSIDEQRGHSSVCVYQCVFNGHTGVPTLLVLRWLLRCAQQHCCAALPIRGVMKGAVGYRCRVP